MKLFPINWSHATMRATQVVSISLGCIILLMLAAFAVAGYELNHMRQQLAPMITRELRSALGRDVRVGSVEVRGFNTVVIHDAAIARGKTFQDGTALRSPLATARVNVIALALRRGKDPVQAISQVVLQRPDVSVARSAQGAWDFQDIIDHINARRALGTVHTQLIIADGKVNYRDAHGLGAVTTPLSEQLVGVNARLTPMASAQYAFAVSGTDAHQQVGTVRFAGSYSRGAGVADMTLSAPRVVVKKLTKFLPKNIPVTFENGTAAVRLSALIRNLPTPTAGHRLPTTALTADVDVSGVGLRWKEMATPIMADSGHLRLVHDAARYPQGSRVSFIGVRGHAGKLPVTVSGKIEDVNLFDLAHANPQFDVTLATSTGNGELMTKLFPNTPWVQQLQLHGNLAVVANASGRRNNLHIDGVIRGERFAMSDVSGEGVSTQFSLVPSGAARHQATITASVVADRARVGNTEMQQLRFSGKSMTPWRELDTAARFDGNAQADSVQLPWGKASAVAGAFTGTKQHIALNGVHAKALGGDLAGDIVFPLYTKSQQEDETVRATARYTGIDLAQLGTALHIADITGVGNGTLKMSIQRGGRLTLDTDLAGKQVVYRNYAASTATTTLHVVSQHKSLSIDIPQAQAETEYGHFSVAKGNYQHHGDVSALNLPLTGEGIVLQKFAKELTGQASISGTLTGTPASPTLTATVTAANGTVLGHKYVVGHGDMQLQGKDLRFRNVVFTRPGMTVNIPGGDTGFDPRNGFKDIPATLTVDGAPLDEVLSLFNQQSPWKVDGGTQGTAQIRLTDAGVVVNGDAHIPKATVHIPQADGEYPLALDDLGLQFDMTGNTMQIRDLSIQRGSSIVHAQGTATAAKDLPLATDLTFQGKQVELGEMPLDLFGVPVALTGQANMQGTLKGELNGEGKEPLQLHVTGDAPQVNMEKIPMGAGSIDLTFAYRPDDRQLTITRGTVRNDAFQATASGQYLLNKEELKDARVDISELQLSKVSQLLAATPEDSRFAILGAVAHALPAQLDGRGSVHLEAKGRSTQPDATIGVDLSQLTLGTAPLPNLHAQLATEIMGGHYGLRIVDATASGGAGEGSAKFSGLIDPKGNVNVLVALKDITAKTLSPWVNTTQVGGSASFDGRVSGSWKSPSLDGAVQWDNPMVAQRHLQKVTADVHATRNAIQLADGQVWLSSAGKPLSLNGEIPLQVVDGRLGLAMQKALSLRAEMPRQSLSVLRPLLPALPAIDGNVAGNVRIGGTLAAPRIADGSVSVDGTANLPAMDKAYPNRINDINLRVRLSSRGSQSVATIERFSAMLDRVEGGQRAKNFNPGWVAADGTMTMAARDLMSPNRWDWNVYARVVRLPLSADLFMVPSISGYLHLQQQGGAPLVSGVMLVDHVTLKEPKSGGSGSSQLGPFSFNPRLSVVLQVGEQVSLKKSIVRLPLRATPLPWPQSMAVTANPSIAPGEAAYRYTAEMMHPGTAAEKTGTWGVVTGTLENPSLYARFEVDKKRVSFPFNLFSSISKARGHVTFNLAEGPRITMGIPDFPQPPVTAAAAPVVQPAAQPKAQPAAIADEPVAVDTQATVETPPTAEAPATAQPASADVQATPQPASADATATTDTVTAQ